MTSVTPFWFPNNWGTANETKIRKVTKITWNIAAAAQETQAGSDYAVSWRRAVEVSEKQFGTSMWNHVTNVGFSKNVRCSKNSKDKSLNRRRFDKTNHWMVRQTQCIPMWDSETNFISCLEINPCGCVSPDKFCITEIWAAFWPMQSLKQCLPCWGIAMATDWLVVSTTHTKMYFLDPFGKLT